MTNQSHAQPDDASQKSLPALDLSHSPLREYEVTLSSGERMYILAASSEDAAWDALELSMDRSSTLINITRTYEW